MKIISKINLLIFFDYIYYCIAYVYTNIFNYRGRHEFPGILFLSLFQLFNAFSLFALFKLRMEFKGNIFLVASILGYFIVFALNYIRYKKIITYNELAAKWGKEKQNIRLIKAVVGVIFYFFLSVWIMQ